MNEWIQSDEFGTELSELSENMAKLVDEAIKARGYRSEYNSREDVMAKRQAYNKARNERVKVAMAEYEANHPEETQIAAPTV